MSTKISKVALLGADGKLGPAIMHALVENGFNVTVLKRKSSKSPSSYPSQILVSDDFNVPELTEALKGIDAVVITVKGSQTDLQKRIAEAAVQAGVKRLIPADFGSCDSSTQFAQDTVPLFKHKANLRQYLTDLSTKNPSFGWTSIVCGHFFDWSLEFLHIYLPQRKAEILDDGAAKWSASSLGQIAEATARILLRPDVTKNRMLYIQSFLVSQSEVIAAYEKATGTKWEVAKFESEKYLEEEKSKAAEGDLEAVENLVWLVGTVDGNWEGKKDFAMEDLGLVEEDLERVVRKTVERLG
ncbi:hypothetical protein M409DRAFT_68811 [Zasmidium cellare ATCC 36951]|uniref:NmrA-like domain-containing protein n=1 Tax=Zasmidium cellare ATCC 36951 TaxID=1080233 RepID=A0A6A6C6S3_ZASCE|nr:uncharacterized protein M409DRAFT_68811 [Zasmidium cellare ATCC 36951]KAF2162814.1 hypothetical protein M409DRAFT_68811 [Zasmidium cellare ATCC 36951]